MVDETEKETLDEEITKISFVYEGTTYTMEFDRDTVSQTEKAFDLTSSDIISGKFTAFYALFYGSLLKHHPNIKPATVEMFIKKFSDKKGIYRALASMYSNCLTSLLNEPDEGNAISWKAM